MQVAKPPVQIRFGKGLIIVQVSASSRLQPGFSLELKGLFLQWTRRCFAKLRDKMPLAPDMEGHDVEGLCERWRPFF